MRTRIALAFATLVLGLLAGTANASKLEFGRTEGGFRVVWSELRFAFAFNGNAAVVRCPVTLAGSFHSATIAKVTNALVGTVARASVATGSCVGGIGREGEVPYPFTAQVLAGTLPWHVKYSAYLGTLPSITGAKVRIVGIGWQVNEGMLRRICLYSSPLEAATGLTFDRESRGVVRTATMEGEGMPFSSGSVLCERIGILEGSGTAAQQSGANLTLTLV